MANFIKDNAFEVWEAHGLDCSMVYGPFGAVNGYVRVPESETRTHYDDFPEVEVHGGLTYGVDENGWVGFDTAHSGDIWPREFIAEHSERPETAELLAGGPHRPAWAIDWTVDMVRDEVESLAQQLGEGR